MVPEFRCNTFLPLNILDISHFTITLNNASSINRTALEEQLFLDSLFVVLVDEVVGAVQQYPELPAGPETVHPVADLDKKKQNMLVIPFKTIIKLSKLMVRYQPVKMKLKIGVSAVQQQDSFLQVLEVLSPQLAGMGADQVGGYWLSMAFQGIHMPFSTLLE